MVKITINYPYIYDDNIQKLIKMKIVSSRTEAIRLAIRALLHKSVDELDLLGFGEVSKT